MAFLLYDTLTYVACMSLLESELSHSVKVEQGLKNQAMAGLGYPLALHFRRYSFPTWYKGWGFTTATATGKKFN